MKSKLIKILGAEIPELTEKELLEFSKLWTIEKQLDRLELLYPKGNTENNIYWSQMKLKLCTLVHLALASKNFIRFR